VIFVSLTGPGLWLARRTGWDPLEKATATLVLSLLSIGVFSFTVAVLHLHPLLHPLAALLCAALLFWQAPAGVRALRRRDLRRDLLAFAALLVWLAALQAVARIYSYGDSYNDWLEHWQRAWFFLGNQPTTTLFTGYTLPARPPLMSAFAAHVLAVTGGRFAVYQWTSLAVAALAYFPALQTARLFGAGRRAPWILAALLAFSPLFVYSATIPWTKMQAAFLTVAALAFYASGVRRASAARVARGDPGADGGRILFAFVCAAAGILLHYSVVATALFLAAHFLLFVLPHRPRPLRDLLTIAAAAAAILVPWFAWAAFEFGPGAVTGAPVASTGWTIPGVAANAAKYALNLYDTLVPPLFRGMASDPRIDRLDWGALRDTAFAFYTHNLVFAFGSTGALVLLYCGWRAWRDKAVVRGSDRERPLVGAWFWIGFALFNLLVNLAMHGGREPLGLAHLTQQPTLLVTLALFAARFETWPRAVRLVVAAGALFDAFAGILLNAWMQMYLADVPSDWHGPLGLLAADLRIGHGDWNLALKEGGHHRFVADLLPSVGLLAWPLIALLLAAGAGLLCRDQRKRRTSASRVEAST
jgi:hypothetical protein